MTAWLFKPRVDGHYLGVGSHTVLVARDAAAGHAVTVDGYRVAERRTLPAALRAGQKAARWIDSMEFDEHAVPTLTDHLATKETTMTTTTKSASAVRSAARRARLKAEAVPMTNRERILKAHGEQQTVGQIAELVGVSHNRVRQVLAATGTVRPKHRDQARNDAIMAAIDAGGTVAEQAALYGLGESRVRTIYQVAKAATS